MRDTFRVFLAAIVAICSGLVFAGEASASLTYFYDPDSGTVAIDTANTRSGGVYVFSLVLNPYASATRFQPEDHIRLTNSTFYSSKELLIGDSSLSEPIVGYHSLGTILPGDLSESMWLTMFDDTYPHGGYRPTHTALGANSYNDIIGGGVVPSPAQFVYGLPDKDFDNRLDLVDPDSLTWASRATLVYHAANGNLDLVTNGDGGGYMTGFVLQSAGHFHPEKYKPPQTVPFSQADESTIGLYANLIEPGKYRLGKILDKGMTLDELESLFTDAKFAGRAGFGSVGFDFATKGQAFKLQFLTVPEPSSIALTGLLLVGLAIGRPMKIRRCTATSHA